jgi:formylglycine-generating enzyme required for sulfatase activity
VTRATAAKPEDRYPTVEALVRAFTDRGAPAEIEARKLAVRGLSILTAVVLAIGGGKLIARSVGGEGGDASSGIRTSTIAADMIELGEGPAFIGCKSAGDPSCAEDEKPGGLVFVQRFSIDRAEVSARAYSACVAAGACTPARRGDACTAGEPERADHPINCVDAAQAEVFCRYLSKRLPTNMEWEKAARAGLAVIYPWGDEAPTCAHANLGGCSGVTLPVLEARGQNRAGLIGMAGNVWEWTADTHGEKRAIRGGSFYDLGENLRASNLGSADPQGRYEHVGFRCARDLPSSLVP